MTTEVRTLSRVRRDEVIRAACDRSERLEIFVGRDGRTTSHSSRFLGAVLGDSGLHLVVEMPLADGKPVTYQPGEDVEGLFHVGGDRYAFSTRIEGACMHDLDDQRQVPALLLAYPRDVESRQRRVHYRVPLSMTSPISIAFMEVPVPGAAWDMSGVFSGFISDISAGGVAVVCRQHLPASMDAGTCLSFSFQLPGEPQHLDLKGIITNARAAGAGEDHILGIEYLRDDRHVAVRRQIDLIQRFVVDRQRDLLKKLRML